MGEEKPIVAPAVFECAVLFADKKSVSGYVYSKEILEEIVEDFKQRREEGIDIVAVVGDGPGDFGINIEQLRIAAVVPSLWIHEGALRASLETIDTTAGHLLNTELKRMKEGKCSVRVFPIGQVMAAPDGAVTEFNLSHFGITAAEGVKILFGDRIKEFNQG